MKKGKRYKNAASLIEVGKDYSLDEAVELIKKTAGAKSEFASWYW